MAKRIIDSAACSGYRPNPVEAKGSAVVLLSFDPSTQELGPLLEAAYCLMSQASCHISSARNRYICRLFPSSADTAVDGLRASFIDLVTDANLRAEALAACGIVSGA